MVLGASVRLFAAALAGAVALVAAAEAIAAQAPPRATGGTREQLNPERQTEEATRRPSDVFSAPRNAPCPLDASNLTITLERIEIDQAQLNGVLDADQVADAYADMKGKAIKVGQLCVVRDRLAAMLFARGVLARVEIPEQRISQGSVRLEVIEARIVSVRYRAVGDVGPARRRVEAYLDKLKRMTPLNLRTAERYLVLANEVPGMTVSASLAAASGSQVRGAVDLEVEIRRKPVDVIVAAQNTGSKALGPWSGVVRADFNSLTALGEKTSLIGYSTIGEDEQKVIQVVEELRLGSSGLFAKGTFAYGRSHPGDTLAPLQLNGRSVVGTAEIDYPLVRRVYARTTLATGLDVVDQTTEFPGGGLLSDDALRIFWVRADAETHRRGERRTALGYISGDLSISLQARKGVDGLGASKAGTPSLSRPLGEPDAWVFRAEGTSSLAFESGRPRTPAVTVSMRWQAQYADRPLLSYEEQAIGNLSIGRGYDPDAVSGDKAIAAEFRAQVGPIGPFGGLSLAPYGFFDVARVSNLDPGSQDRTVRSAGLGAEIRFASRAAGRPYGLRADVAWAKPLDKPFASAAAKPPSRVLVQLVAAF